MFVKTIRAKQLFGCCGLALWLLLAAAAGAAEWAWQAAPELVEIDFATRAGQGLPEGWQSASDPAGAAWQITAEGLVCPPLKNGQRLELRSAPLDVRGWHRYRVDVNWRGGLFYVWSVAVVYRLEGDLHFEQPLYPGRKGVAPAPALAERSFHFIVPRNAVETRLVLAVRAEPDRGHRPALRAITVTDEGREPLPEAPRMLPPHPVPAAALAEHEGGWGHLRREKPSRHLLNQCGAGFDQAGVLLTSLWARGEGSMRLTARVRNIGGRFMDYELGPWQLSEQWTEYNWELPVVFPKAKNLWVTIVADVTNTGPFELDQPIAKGLQSRAVKSLRTADPMAPGELVETDGAEEDDDEDRD